MKSLKIIIALIAISFVTMGSSCRNTDSTIILPSGPQATALSAEKDKQIKEQAKQITDLQSAREQDKKQASLAAANFEGVLYGAEHVDPGLPRNAIEEEAKLGKARLPDPDPQEVIKAKDRVIAILQNEVEKAKALYGKAFDEAAQAKAESVQKDKEIAQRDLMIKDRDVKIDILTQAAKNESDKHKTDIENLIARKDKEREDLRKEFESKERAQWVLWTRIAGLGLIVIGSLVMVVLKAFPEGGGLISSGVIIGLVSIFIDWLTHQIWFPWAIGTILLTILIAGGYMLYRAWKTKTLHAKTTAALQDLKDEAFILGHDTWEKVSEHLKYRLGDKNSPWGKEQAKTLVQLGLIDPKGEELLRNQPPKVDKPVS